MKANLAKENRGFECAGCESHAHCVSKGRCMEAKHPGYWGGGFSDEQVIAMTKSGDGPFIVGGVPIREFPA